MPGRADRTKFTILGEGLGDYYFAKAFLESAFGKNKVECYRSQTIPGAGSGEQQVRRIFPRELSARRRRPRDERHWLVVITDGDLSTPDQRRNQLEQQAAAIGLERTDPEEKVAVFVPCRNIESWFQWLETAEQVDETKDYKSRFSSAKPVKYGRQLKDKCLRVAMEDFPPSLQDACEQWKRMT